MATQSPKSKRGGKRAGAGAKRKSPLGLVETVSISLVPNDAALLREIAAKRGTSVSSVVAGWIGLVTDY